MAWKEEDIVAGCIRKKRKAQKALYQKYYRVLLGICMRYCESKPEAEDVLIEGFMNIYNKISTYSGKGSFEGWMKRVMVNTAIDNYRKNLKHYYHEDIEAITNQPSGQSSIPDDLAAEEILALILLLPKGYRIVFNLFAIEGYSHKEIAEELGISENTSKTQLLKARKYLQKLLKETEMEVNLPVNNE
ncbi:MAG: sigma-70 family RNA polymerase sigma factor [Bacteroidales bacterium]|nr:sigma-70 family RNA polymerase sigma factor [Bacteroidales bacterium]